jgi:4-hydroxybenzoate polyprenyltransferase
VVRLVNQADSPFTNSRLPSSIGSESMPRLLRTWLQLFRAPNLFTVPGDPLAGYLLASYGAVEPNLFLPLTASICFYAGGLLLNDLVDFREDLAERPQRPLPSGAANRIAVGVVTGALFLGGLALCFLVGAWTLGVGGVLLAAILSYNLECKRLPIVGALNMGLCRGLSVLLGATAVPHGELSIRLMAHGRLNHLMAAAVFVTLYIAAVTNLARFETKGAAPVFARWLPATVVVAGWITFFPMVGGVNRRPAFVLFLLAFLLSAHASWELSRPSQTPLPAVIGKLIRLLLVLQAAFCAATGPEFGSLSAALLILCWPLSRAVGQRFYGS